MQSERKRLRARLRQLEKENKALEKKLRWERLKSRPFETLIEITEGEMGIPVKK